jgi:hypothetical protein
MESRTNEIAFGVFVSDGNHARFWKAAADLAVPADARSGDDALHSKDSQRRLLAATANSVNCTIQ